MTAARLTADLLLRAYGAGIFPMAESRDDPELFWVDPRRRGVFDLARFHISRSLAKRLRRGGYEVRVDHDFAGVVAGCAERPDTWINAEIFALYQELHHQGHAHSVEVWQGADLIGGVYGVVLGGAFFGESMFSRRTDASKIALAFLVDRLRVGGFALFDTQFITPHLASLGAQEISRAEYRARLGQATALEADFHRLAGTVCAQEVLQRSIHTS